MNKSMKKKQSFIEKIFELNKEQREEKAVDEKLEKDKDECFKRYPQQ